MLIQITGGRLEVDFDCAATKTSFSICDLAGKEMKAGKLEQASRHILDLGGISAGIYNLCIIDGDQLHKTKFQVT
jgi:hypothetical protein